MALAAIPEKIRGYGHVKARHLEAVKTSMEKGSPVHGYFVWSLIDNWEWDQGFTSKFGLCSQDRVTGKRTPKASYAWFKALAASNRLAL